MKIKLGELKRVIGSVVREMAGDDKTFVLATQDEAGDLHDSLAALPAPVTVFYGAEGEYEPTFYLKDGEGKVHQENTLSRTAHKAVLGRVKQELGQSH